jgi:hypothetical protein
MVSDAARMKKGSTMKRYCRIDADRITDTNQSSGNTQTAQGTPRMRIKQDTRRIDHADSPEELRRVGRDIERTVLGRGVRWHLQDRILVNGTKTIVFA